MKSSKKITSRVVSTKPLGGAGDQPELSAKIGGVGNTSTNAIKNEKKGK
jgi:hypothetical protein